MRHGTAGRRSRNRGGNNPNAPRRNTNSRTHVYDSNGPDVRIRGTAHQICEKYMALAKDAAASGDRILSESYLQHAEHYQRLINEFTDNVRDNRDNSYNADAEHSGMNSRTSATEPADDLGLPASILGKTVVDSPVQELESV